MKDDSASAPKIERERSIRWQKIAIDQLGYAGNLILTFTIATLGYSFALLKDASFTPAHSAKCTLVCSLLLLAVSALSGMFFVLNRLLDFRGTAKRARLDPTSSSKEALRGMGRRTWCSFYSQAVTFTLGVIALAITLLLTYGGKLL